MQRLSHNTERAFLAARVDMRVASGSDVCRMPQIGLDLPECAALMEQQGRAGMSQVMKPKPGQTAARDLLPEVVGDVRRRHEPSVLAHEDVCRIRRAVAGSRRPMCDLRPPSLEPRPDVVRQRERAAAGLGLEVVGADKLCHAVQFDLSYLVADVHHAGFEVHVLPSQAEDLAAPQAIYHGDVHDVFERIALKQPEQRMHLLDRVGGGFKRLDLGRLDAPCRIEQRRARPDLVVEDGLDQGQVVRDRVGRQSSITEVFEIGIKHRRRNFAGCEA